MFPVSNPAQISNSSTKGSPNIAPTPQNSSREIKESECFLTSIKSLRQKLLKGKHRREFVCHWLINRLLELFIELSEILEKHTFVGIVDLPRSLSLIQYSTNLYLVNHGSLAYVLVLWIVDSNVMGVFREELFYQLGLRQFGDFRRLKLEPPPPLWTLVEIGVDAEGSVNTSKLSKTEVVDVSFIRACRESTAF